MLYRASFVGQPVDDEECADGVMADEAVPVIKRPNEGAYREGITEHCKRQRGIEPPHVVNILVGEYLGHGREPGSLGTDLPQRLRETYRYHRRLKSRRTFLRRCSSE